jgi:hypothetical protein
MNMPVIDEFTKVELAALKSELMNWQSLRFNLLGVAVSLEAAFSGWVATSASKLAPAVALIPILVVLIFAAIITSHAARLVYRLATYFQVFYDSPWEARLTSLRSKADPWQVNRWLAALYVALSVAATSLVFISCEAKSSPESSALALMLATALAVALVDLASVGRCASAYRELWLAVKSAGGGQALP